MLVVVPVRTPGLPAASAGRSTGAAHLGTGLAIGPAVELPSPEEPAACRNTPPGWMSAESGRRGADLLPAIARYGVLGPVAGYLDRSSARCGEAVGLHLSAWTDTPTRVQALRVGSYRGGPARVVWQHDLLVHRQSTPTAPAARTTVVASWPVTLTLRPTAQWPPGLYLLRIFRIHDPARASFVPLRVLTSGTRAPLLVISSDLTELAYNAYGGTSLYDGPGRGLLRRASNRAYTAAVDRPLSGSGLAQVFRMEVPLARLLDHFSIGADWTTDSSVDLDPAQLAGYRGIILPGHSEYWTRAMYDALSRQVGEGTNLAVLGANELYWQARVQRDARGRLTGMTVFRDRSLDPVADRALTTTQWRAWPLNRDPAALTGVGRAAVGVHGDYHVVSAPPWLFRGVPLHPGGVISGAVGNETDAVEAPGGHSPADVQVILSGQAFPAGSGSGRPTLATAAYYAAPSGAGVFAAGTTYWLCGSEGTCPGPPSAAGTRDVLTRLTVNVLQAFTHPRWGRQAPSTPTAPGPGSRRQPPAPVGALAVTGTRAATLARRGRSRPCP
jgi:hypothetical protein